jgi:Zn-dependent protease
MLRFRLLGIPVGVHITFGVVALLGATVYRGVDIAWWTVAAFVSILLHEMGHALTARRFGASDISVTLYGLGGLTTFRHGVELGHGKSFLISAAGSFFGIVAGGAVFLLADAGVFDGASRAVVVLVNSFVFTALVWGVLNWIPVVPLDGGHMVQHLISLVDEERAPFLSQVITWITLGILAPIAWINGYRFAVLILGFFAIAGWREYRDDQERRRAAHARAESEAVRGTVVDGTVVAEHTEAERPLAPAPQDEIPDPGDRPPSADGAEARPVAEEPSRHPVPPREDPPSFPI